MKNKFIIMEKFKDERLKYFAEILIFEEQPDLLERKKSREDSEEPQYRRPSSFINKPEDIEVLPDGKKLINKFSEKNIHIYGLTLNEALKEKAFYILSFSLI